MESLEFNKIAFAVLSTLLFVMGVGIVANTVFPAHPPAKPGYALPEAAAAGAAAVAAAPAMPVSEMMAKADPKRGESTMNQQCKSCHTVEKGGKPGIGPNLYGIVDRPIASFDGFAYSPGLLARAKSDGKWSFENLVSFVGNPRGYASGTKMAYNGLKDPQRLGDVLSYLRGLSDNPVAMPK